MKPLRKKKKIKPDKPSKKPMKATSAPAVPTHVITHSKATMGRQEEQAASKVIHGGYVGSGDEVAKFEYEFCKFLGLAEGHAVALSSGTAARYLALWALEARGKTVAIPAYSTGLRNAVALIGANAYCLELEEGSVNADFALAAAAKADILFLSHMFGIPSVIRNIESKSIIEDCSQAIGAKVKGAHVGLVGDMAVYSFDCDQIITTGGQGGMLVAKELTQAEKVRSYRDHAKSEGGFNFNLTDIQAAIGRVQLEKLPRLLARREEIFEAYKDAGFKIIEQEQPEATAVRQSAVLQTEHSDTLLRRLKEACVETVIPVDKLTASEAKSCPLAAKLSQTTLSLPIHPHLSNDEVREILDQLDDALGMASAQP